MKSTMMKKGLTALALTASVAFASTASAAITYSEDFEDRIVGDGGGVGDGWVIGNVNETTGGSWFAGFAAPTGVSAWADFVDEGGPAQGGVQLSAYTDYNNGAQNTDVVKGFLYRDLGAITADMVGLYSFSYDAKLGNIVGGVNPAGEAEAYVNVLKTSDGSFGTMLNVTADALATLPGDQSWGGNTIQFEILPEMVGELLQIGFSHRNPLGVFQDSGVIYDNLNVAPVPLPAAAWLFGSALLGLVGVSRRRKA